MLTRYVVVWKDEFGKQRQETFEKRSLSSKMAMSLCKKYSKELHILETIEMYKLEYTSREMERKGILHNSIPLWNWFICDINELEYYSKIAN